MSVRVAILCGDDAHHQYLIRTLCNEFDVVAVVVEPGRFQRARHWRKKRYGDYAYALYHTLRRKWCGLDAYRRHYFALPTEAPVPDHGPNLVVESVNDPSVADLLKQSAPDVTIVMGTSILRKKTLRAAGKTVINIHGGYLPFYRGNHCFFFACYEGRFDRVGSTIHFVDAGVDTGQVIEVVRPPLQENDIPETLYCRAEKMAIYRLVDWLHLYARTRHIPAAVQEGDGRTIRTRDRKPYHDLLYWFRRKTGLLKIPVSEVISSEIREII